MEKEPKLEYIVIDFFETAGGEYDNLLNENKGKRFYSIERLNEILEKAKELYPEDETGYSKVYLDNFIRYGEDLYKFHYGRVDIDNTAVNIELPENYDEQIEKIFSENINSDKDYIKASIRKITKSKEKMDESVSPLTAFEKKAKDIAEKLGLGIKFTGNDRFELDTLDKEKVQEFYKEVFNVDIGDLKGLNENMLPNEEYIKTHEEEIENTVQTNYFYEIVNNLIKDEIEAITGYDKAITSFVNLGIMNYIDILKDIANEEKVHIGQLQTILEDLKPGTEKKFDDGQKEGKEQIVQEETNEEKKTNIDEDFDNNESDLSKATPYMLRNDGTLIECKPMHPYIKFVYENIEDCLRKLSGSRFFALEWFYNNTLKEDTKNNIRIIVNYLISKNMVDFNKQEYFGITNETYTPNDSEIEGFVETTNADTNQEFLRTRTSSLLFGGNSNDIYFRISSIRYNWFENIWNLVNKYSNSISNITIGKDSNTFGGRFEPYKIDGQTIDHLPINEFITLPGNPIIEKLTNSKIKAISEAEVELKNGKSISEAYNYLHPNYVSGFYHKQVEDNLQDDMEKILRKEG